MSEPLKHLVLLIFLSSLIDIIIAIGTCPAHCISCYNSEVCYNCTEGYYGLSCEKNCTSSTCLNNTCDKDSGTCLHRCIGGYFLSGSSCYPCASNCNTCANFSNNCLECKDGYYGPTCQYQCSRCKDSICNRDNCTYGCRDGFFRGTKGCNSCNKNCTSCSIQFDNCHTCVDGYFGSDCQFVCGDCSPCNQNGSCHLANAKGQTPSSTMQQTNPSNEPVKTSFPTTTISTIASTQTSQESSSIQNNNNIIIYAAAGGGGGLVVIVLLFVVVVVCKRRDRAKESVTVPENIDMTENENYISAEDIDEISRNSTNAQNGVKQNKQEDNGDLYSVPNKIHRPTVVTMETRSGQETEDSPSNLSPTIPVKSNMYSDLI